MTYSRQISALALCASVMLGCEAHAGALTAHEQEVIDGIIARGDGDKLAEAQNKIAAATRTKRRAANRTSPASATPTVAVPIQSVAYLDDMGTLVRKREKSTNALIEHSKCPGLTFLLRRDWKDIGFLDCPMSVDKATGAEIAFAGDRANHNQIWAINGTAALSYSSVHDSVAWWDPGAKSLATYVTVNRAFNSASEFADSNVDKLAYGVAAEIGYLVPDGGHFFRLRGGGVENNIKQTSSAAVTLEYLPTSLQLYFQRPIPHPLGLPVILRFDPEILLQYNQTTGKGQLLDFNNMTRALRIGPQVTAHLFPDPLEKGFLGRMSASFSYHWAHETYSRTELSWLDATLKYNIDDAGHLALALTYQRGNDEDTGTFANIYRIGLTGKI
jgi:hypothetical protein